MLTIWWVGKWNALFFSNYVDSFQKTWMVIYIQVYLRFENCVCELGCRDGSYGTSYTSRHFIFWSSVCDLLTRVILAPLKNGTSWH